eukprot:TRINITY_DN2327_c0_g1_i3.p1 TRINITY_DN2327_c0_g1~~TRINITY_DN2327_c0_g1_i3.p1  ORF type:complete len:248 (-),score=34.59 TRINITY_DN2327_c0_g1_i3:32-775(-)
MISSGHWEPDEDGEYFIDRSPKCFDIIADYLRSKEWKHTKDLRRDEIEQLKLDVEYYQLEFPQEVISLSNIDTNYEVRMLMVGLDMSGKTTILYKLKLGGTSTIPTIGFNNETIQYKNINFAIWDVGGQDRIRPLWRHYFQHTQCLLFVVDSNDRDRIDEAVLEFQKLLYEDELRDALILVLANKQDLPNAMTIAEITELLGLHSLRARRWFIQPTCAISGDGLYEGLEWLSNKIIHDVNLRSIVQL